MLHNIKQININKSYHNKQIGNRNTHYRPSEEARKLFKYLSHRFQTSVSIKVSR